MINQISKKNLIVAGLLLTAFFVTAYYSFIPTISWINRQLGAPDLSILEDYQPIGSIEIYDYQDNFVGVLQGKEDRLVVPLTKMSDYVKQAVLAAEDSDFYHHHGFSFVSFARALLTNIKAGKVVQGGSTISQQMVKNLFIKEDERYKRTITRKIVELFIAFEVENKYSKDRILEIYLNQVYFGNLAYGIERASQRYFAKSSSELTIAEASYLAGLLTAPSYLAKNLDAAKKRQSYVLSKMLKNGYIDQADYDAAKEVELEFKQSKGNLSKFPYYFAYIEQELSHRFTRAQLKSMGLKVYTGLDPEAQKLAKQSLNTGVTSAAQGINQGAMVTIDVDSAQIRALVGGVGNYWEHQYNRATNIHTLGSAFKPFVYLTAFMEGVIDPSSVIEDEELELEDISSETMIWSPKNFDEEFHGPLTAKAALIFSRNIPAVKVAMKTGMKKVVQTARAAGMESPMEPLLSLALGAQGFAPLEVASAYSTFARGGVRIDPILIRKIVDSSSRVLEVNKPVSSSSLPSRFVGQLVRILKEVVQSGTGTVARLPGRPMAGKTGTADGSRDIWFTGFTRDYVTTVWCGNEKNEEVLSRYATGGGTPAWIWKDMMSKYYKSRPRPARDFNFDEDYILVSIDPLTQLRSTDFTPNPVFKRFKRGMEPTEYAPTPDVERIKSRDKQSFLKFMKGLSKEDKKIKTLNQIEQEEREEKIKQIEKPVIPKYKPKPKIFKIQNLLDAVGADRKDH